jgi:hypothetical protein
MSIHEIEANAVLAVSIVVTERRENLYGIGVELAQQKRPIRHLALCSEAISKEAAAYSAFAKIAQHIPDDVKLLLVRCDKNVHISRHAVRRKMQTLENAQQIYISNAQLYDYRFRKLLDLAESSIHGRSTVQTLSKI